MQIISAEKHTWSMLPDRLLGSETLASFAEKDGKRKRERKTLYFPSENAERKNPNKLSGTILYSIRHNVFVLDMH